MWVPLDPHVIFDLVKPPVDLLMPACHHTDVIFHFLLIKIIPEIQIIFKNSYLLNRSSDRKSLYMKVAQNDEPSLIMPSVSMPEPPK
jgi:hypothetical protein